MLSKDRLKHITEQFSKIKVAVIGDFFLDRIFIIDRSLDEPSVETGLTAYQVVSRKLLPGAAGVATNNLNAFGVKTIYSMGIMGNDGEAFELVKGLNLTNVCTDYMVSSEEIFTPTYTKTMFDYRSGLEETHRIDIKNRRQVPRAVEEKVLENLSELAGKVDAIIALEQLAEGKNGVFTGRVIDRLAEISKNRPGLVVIADSRSNILHFHDIIVKCNDLEAVHSVYPEFGLKKDEKADGKLVAKCLAAIEERSGKRAFVSCGAKGMMVLKNGSPVVVPAYRVEGPIDICGAGDSATAAIACALSAGADAEEAALIGNLTASITIQQIGVTGIATVPQMLQRYDDYIKQNS